LLYVEDHLLLVESMMCMDNVLVDELTFMLKMHFHSIGPGIGLMPCFDEVQLIFAV